MARRKRNLQTVIEYQALLAALAGSEMTWDELAQAIKKADGGDRPSLDTLNRFLYGAENMAVGTIKRCAAGLGLRVRVTFEPITESATEAMNVVEMRRAA